MPNKSAVVETPKKHVEVPNNNTIYLPPKKPIATKSDGKPTNTSKDSIKSNNRKASQ